MLTEIKLENYKCFLDETTFPLGKLTILAGANGKGKSSLIQSLLMFSQSENTQSDFQLLCLNGTYINVGSYNTIRNSDSLPDSPVIVSIEIENGGGSYANVRYQINRHYTDDDLGKVEDEGVAIIEQARFSGIENSVDFSFDVVVNSFRTVN